MHSRSRTRHRTATTNPIAEIGTECIVGVDVIVVAAIARTGPTLVAEIRKAPRSIQVRTMAVTNRASLSDRKHFVATS